MYSRRRAAINPAESKNSRRLWEAEREQWPTLYHAVSLAHARDGQKAAIWIRFVRFWTALDAQKRPPPISNPSKERSCLFYHRDSRCAFSSRSPSWMSFLWSPLPIHRYWLIVCERYATKTPCVHSWKWIIINSPWIFFAPLASNPGRSCSRLISLLTEVLLVISI